MLCYAGDVDFPVCHAVPMTEVSSRRENTGSKDIPQ